DADVAIAVEIRHRRPVLHAPTGVEDQALPLAGDDVVDDGQKARETLYPKAVAVYIVRRSAEEQENISKVDCAACRLADFRPDGHRPNEKIAGTLNFAQPSRFFLF